jgi:3-deoxy-D-manno-octulosonate 8-phosphate phosphatase (KDO 8-P phosphatase)
VSERPRRKSAAARRAPSPAKRAKAKRAVGRKPVRVLFLDVDGTLTDGVIGFTREGDVRHFWVRDGLALEWAREHGVVPVVISGRPSLAVAARMNELGLEHYLGAADKVAVAEQVLAREGATWAECAMVGDDLPDVPLMRRVGWPIAVADASPEVRAVAKTVTRAGGGRGAVREAVERLLRHNGAWKHVLARYEVTR